MSIQDCIACAPAGTYDNNPFNEDKFDLIGLMDSYKYYDNNIEVISQVFPEAALSRNIATEIFSHNNDFNEITSTQYKNIKNSHNYIIPSFLVRINKAVIWNNMIFVNNSGRLMPVYEFYRKTDRIEKGPHLIGRVAACPKHDIINVDQEDKLFVGSAGSFNYGHWLIDDLPAISGSNFINNDGRKIRLLMSGYSGSLNDIKLEGIGLLDTQKRISSSLFLDLNVAYHIENLYYVTPSSYHPHSKNPSSLEFVRRLFASETAGSITANKSRKIFINRKESSIRKIKNIDEVRAYLVSIGYEEYIPEDLSFQDQISLFKEASDVIGIMGASMASTVVCPVGTKITHLAPLGWVEPFYWDLSAVMGHKYSVIYGDVESIKSNPHLQDFTVDINLLISCIGNL